MGLPGQTPTNIPGPAPLGIPRPTSMDFSGQPPMNMPGIPSMGIPVQSQMNTPGQSQMNVHGQQQPMNVFRQPPMNIPGQQQLRYEPTQQQPMNIPDQQLLMYPPKQPLMNIPGQQPLMNIPGQQPSMNIPGQQPSMNIPGQPPLMNIPGQQPLMNILGQPPLMNIPGQQPMPMPGPPEMMNETKQSTKLDPDQLPSAVKVREDDKIEKSGVFLTGYPTAELPPLITTECTVQDQGNSSPRFIRSTLYNVPSTNDMINVSHLPFGITCRPLCRTMPGECIPPIAVNSDTGPVRCQRCKAYMCSFMKFIDGGRRFKCPFCDASTPITDDYFNHIDHTGMRMDINCHPEFQLGSYEFIATPAYCKNNVKPNEPAFIFMLDVSYNAINNGLVDIFCKNFINLLDKFPKEANQNKSTIKVGFITYDNKLHFYNLSSKSKKPEMSIVNDLNDIFIPFVEGFLVDVSEAKESIEKILNEIPNLFGDSKITDICLGPVIQAGLDALKITDRSGKMFVFNTSLPTLEAPGKLTHRDDKNLGNDKKHIILSPNGDFYTKLGEECAKNGVSVDLFLFPNSFIDVASLSPLVSISGGHLYKYQYFGASNEGKMFLADFEKCISRNIGFDAIMRIRTSYGLCPESFYGHFLMQNNTDMEFGTIDEDKEVVINIKYDDKLLQNQPCYIQAALLYTTVSGERRIRIHNISLKTTDNYLEIYKGIDNDTLIAYFYKYCGNVNKTKNGQAMKEEITNICAHILATYREKCSDNSPIGQLVLPECLKLLPLYFCSILKNDGLTGGSDLHIDDRAWLAQMIGGLTTKNIINFLYPSIIPVTGVYLENKNQEFYIPPEVRGSYEYLKSDESYLIKSANQLFLWIGKDVSDEWIRLIFNVANSKSINVDAYDVSEYDNPYSRGLCKIIKMIQNDIVCHSRIKIVRQNDPLEAWMKRFLVEDRFAGQNYSYVDALCVLHREIRFILS